MNRAGYDIHDRRANGLASTSNSEASLIDLDSPPASSTTPLFPALAQPLVPGTILIPQSKSDFEQESTSPDGFGEFVSVSPSLDPLAAGPGQFSPFSPRPQSNTFAEGAQKRSDENGRRVLEEIDEFEKRGNPSDPSYFPSLAGWDQADDTKLSSSFSELESSLAEASAESVFHHKASPRPRRYSSISRSPTVLSPTLPPPPPIVQSVEVLRDPPSPELSTSSSPPLTQRLSRTLPRKWSSFFSNPGTQPAETHHTSSPPIPAAFISHSSPFAAQPYIPPTGAPGFTGDKNWDKGFAFTEVEKAGNSVKLLARSENTIPVLDTSTADLIRPHLPALFRLPPSWKLLFSLDQHGISLNTFYSLIEKHQDQVQRKHLKSGCVLAIQDSEDNRFGVWLGEGIRPGKGSYYGSGESFLWKAITHDGLDPRVKVFKWTGRNDYVALCEHNFISFGGGDGKYGLYLDSSLFDGSSAPCSTFNNEVLCQPGDNYSGKAVNFECVGLEVWGVGGT